VSVALHNTGAGEGATTRPCSAGQGCSIQHPCAGKIRSVKVAAVTGSAITELPRGTDYEDWLNPQEGSDPFYDPFYYFYLLRSAVSKSGHGRNARLRFHPASSKLLARVMAWTSRPRSASARANVGVCFRATFSFFSPSSE
jgi:hypothetical protein